MPFDATAHAEYSTGGRYLESVFQKYNAILMLRFFDPVRCRRHHCATKFKIKDLTAIGAEIAMLKHYIRDHCFACVNPNCHEHKKDGRKERKRKGVAAMQFHLRQFGIKADLAQWSDAIGPAWNVSFRDLYRRHNLNRSIPPVPAGLFMQSLPRHRSRHHTMMPRRRDAPPAQLLKATSSAPASGFIARSEAAPAVTYFPTTGPPSLKRGVSSSKVAGAASNSVSTS